MATLTLQRTGNWSDTSAITMPWTALTGSGAGGVAGNGDTVINGNALFTLTIDGTQACGTGGPTIAGIFAPTVGANTGGTNTSLPTGTYYVRIVPVSAGGIEGSMSPESSLALPTSPLKPLITLPALPTGASSWSIYMTTAGTGSGGITHRRYATGKAGSSTFEPLSASWEDGTVTFASAQLLSPSSGIYGVGIINLAAGASLTVSGDFMSTHSSGSTFGAGSSITVNTSSGITYFIQPGTTSSQVSPLICNGTSGSHVTIAKSGSGTVRIGGYGVSGGNFGNGCVRASYTDFNSIGSASTVAVNGRWIGSELYSFGHCIIDGCGAISIQNGQPTGQLSFSYNEIRNPLVANTLLIDGGSSYTSGTRSITNNVNNGLILFSTSPRNYTITGNYLTNGVTHSGVPLGGTWSSFSDNLYMRSVGSGSAQLIAYDVTDCYCFMNEFNVRNPHPFDPSQVNENREWARNVFEYIGVDNSGDVLLPTRTVPASTYSLNVHNNIYLPNALGDSMGTPVTLFGNSKLSVAFDYNTYTMGIQGFAIAESYDGYAGMVTSFTGNLAWNPAKLTQGWVILDSLSGDPISAVAGMISTCDYNGKWNYSTTGPRSGTDAALLAAGYYGGDVASTHYAFASTPGIHDVNADPQFYDHTRSLVMFDQGFLAKPVGTTWAAGTSYSVGDIVSSTVSGVFFDQVVNYRCTAAHTSTSSTVPYDANSGDIKYGRPYTRVGPTHTLATTIGSSYTVTFRSASGSFLATGSIAASATAATIASTVQVVARTVTGDSTVVVTGSGGPLNSAAVTLDFTYSSGGTHPYAVGFLTVTASGNETYSSDWSSQWEFASLYWLRTAILAGTTYTDTTLGITGVSPVAALKAWVSYGWRPTNTAFRGTGPGGTDIGAVSVLVLTSTTDDGFGIGGSVFSTGSISTGGCYFS